MLSTLLNGLIKGIHISHYNYFNFYNTRQLVFHKSRRVIGHKLEFITGKHRSMRINPPKIPIHPIEDVSKNMKLFETYRDLRLRWKKSTCSRRKRLRIARKWRLPNNIFPMNKPTCLFVEHKNLPFTRPISSDYISHTNTASLVKQDSTIYPPDYIQQEILEKRTPVFCIFKSGPHHQHKVTVGDLVQAEKLHCKVAGDKVTFGTVLLVGSRDWTIIGKPTVPYAKVKATVEQQTLCGEQISFYYRKKNRTSKFKRVRHYVTILRIDDITVDSKDEASNNIVVPKRLLDLWSNRWLYNHELKVLDSINTTGNKSSSGGESNDLHKQLQHTYHKRGVDDCYRWPPDPYTKHRGL